MASIIASPEIAEHLSAALALSKREVFIRLLNSAQEMLQAGQLVAAGLIAGVVLDCLRQERGADSPVDRERAKAWLDFRNRIAHLGSSNVPFEQLSEMIGGIRNMLVTQPSITSGIAAPQVPADSVPRDSRKVRLRSNKQ